MSLATDTLEIPRLSEVERAVLVMNQLEKFRRHATWFAVGADVFDQEQLLRELDDAEELLRNKCSKIESGFQIKIVFVEFWSEWMKFICNRFALEHEDK